MATKAQTPLICEICYSNNDVNFYCVNCAQKLCFKCKQDHSRIKKTKNDTVIPLAEAQLFKSAGTLCTEHPGEEISFYCEQCDHFICGECMDGQHQEHKISTLKKTKSKRAKLVKFMEHLEKEKAISEKAWDIENNVYTKNTKCYENVKREITDHVNKINKGLNPILMFLKDEKFTELSTLQEQETRRHAHVLNSIESNIESLMNAIQLIQTGINSDNPSVMTTAEVDARQCIRNMKDIPQSREATTKFKPGSINIPLVLPLFGDVIHRETDVKKVTLMNTIKTENKNYSIKLMIPLPQDRAWVASFPDKYLTLVNKDGKTLKISMKLCEDDSSIMDAKQYNQDVLVTCYKQHTIIRMDTDGKTKKLFADISPYFTRGLCVSHTLDVLLCVGSKFDSHDEEAKVLRLNSNGDVIQVIKYDGEGNMIYSWPFDVTSLQSGEVIVTDRGQHKRVSCVKNDGQVIFTWSGELQGKRYSEHFMPYGITHDKYNNLFIADYDNHRIYVLRKDGTEARCLLDVKQGMKDPYGLVVDPRGQLWVGCAEGTVRVYNIEY